MLLHATWTPEGNLFFWSSSVTLDQAAKAECPAMATLDGKPTRRVLAVPEEDTVERRPFGGFEVPVGKALPLLCNLDHNAAVSASMRCWSYAAKLALELATAQRVVPTVHTGKARWSALLARDQDVQRYEALIASIPVVARALPTRTRGNVRLYTAKRVAREFLDHAVDSLYRQNAHPGSTRGWSLELAQALRSPSEDSFQPRDARFQGIPEMLAGWTAAGTANSLRLSVGLDLPSSKGRSKRPRFPLRLWLHAAGDPAARVPLAKGWAAGKSVRIDGVRHPHPATAALTGLARMSRIYPPLTACLDGDTPRETELDVVAAWAFIAEGAPLLEDGGFHVELPEAFAKSGSRRMRARIRIEPPQQDEHGSLDMGQLLRFRWEVVLGDRMLSGDQFKALTSLNAPIVEFDGDWVLLDPDQLAKLPKGLPQEGELPASTALRAVLTGEHDGVEVVADAHLDLVLQALRSPPEVPPPDGLDATLRGYQREGLSWLATLGQLGLGSCLADDMGLGKTIQLIAHILRRREQRRDLAPALVVCPTSVLGNWKREIARFAPSLKVARYHGANRADVELDKADVVLTTYGLLVRDEDMLCGRQWDVIALDEAQAIKNPESRRAQVAKQLQGRHRVAMTGTPVENRLDELWSLYDFLLPGLLGGRGAFRQNFAIPIERHGNHERAHKLRLGVSPFLLRRLKSDPDIIDDLPDKVETIDYCALKPEQAHLYQRIVDEAMGELADVDGITRRGRVLAMLTRLKQACNHPVQVTKEADGELPGRSGKLERFTELIDSILEIGEQGLIFTQYREMGELLQRHFLETFELEIPFLHGGVSADARDEMVRAFQEGPDAPPFLLVSLKAGGTGLNLTAASHVIHYDRWWNPAVEDQATDRAYRIGQRKNVQVHKMVSQGTLEERIHQMLEEKRQLADSVVTAEGWVTELDDAALRALVSLGDDAVEEE